MLTVDEAVDAILTRISVLEPENRPLLDAFEQNTSEDIFASIDVPGFPVSARDGFAVRSEDIVEASSDAPRSLRVIETVMAGSMPHQRVSQGTAIRIMTGAPIPSGADCVVEFEDTDSETHNSLQPEVRPSEVAIYRAEKAGANIRQAGEQLSRGSLLISRGCPLGPAEAGLLAASGYTHIPVISRPVVAVIATGEELMDIGQPLNASQIYSGSSYSLAGLIRKYGGIPQIIGIARDNRASLITKIREGMAADMVITTGGVSMGDRDLVKGILSELGEVVFQQVRMSPGKNVAFALLNKVNSAGQSIRIPHFALTGSPPGSLLNFEVLVRPAILKLAGRAKTDPEIVEAAIEDKINNKESYRKFVWVKVENRNGCLYACPTSNLPCGVLSSIAASNGLAVIPESVRNAGKGDRLQVILLPWH